MECTLSASFMAVGEPCSLELQTLKIKIIIKFTRVMISPNDQKSSLDDMNGPQNLLGQQIQFSLVILVREFPEEVFTEDPIIHQVVGARSAHRAFCIFASFVKASSGNSLCKK